ncbi:hypothetical protein [Sphingobacterium faecium]
MNNPILMVDPTGMAADTIHLRPVDVFKDAPKREPVQGLWQHTVHTFNGGNDDGYQYDRQGKPIGFSPTMGMPPDFSFATKPLKILELASKIYKVQKVFKGVIPAVKKAVNSNLPHAVERGVFATKTEASAVLKNLTSNISKNGFPSGSILDPSYVDRVLVPIGNGGVASYQVAKNGTASLKTVLIAK